MKQLAPYVIALIAVCAPAAAQQPVAGTPVLWHDPGAIADKNLTYGPGSADRLPKPPFTFIKEDESGSKPKVRVSDANGVEWNVKFAGAIDQKNEVNAEVAANRIAWALGYVAEEHYFVPEGRIEGVKDLKRAKGSIADDGSFRIARFERREPSTSRPPVAERRWSFDDNPFAGSRELSGLKILLALLNNWDNKPANTSIESVTAPDGSTELRYLFSDWGASFGRMAGPPSWTPSPTRWRVEDYKAQPLTTGVDGTNVKLFFLGQVPMDTVPIEHARWFVELASQLKGEQLRAAFEAAGAPAADADAFAAVFLSKVDQLRAVVSPSQLE
jgi:hypothetical protein